MRTPSLLAALLVALLPTETESSSKPSVKSHITVGAGSAVIDESNSTEALEFRTSPRKAKAKNQAKNKVKGEAMNRTAGETTAHRGADVEIPEKKRRKRKKNSNESTLGGQEAATLRRIKREWKDAVKLGIAYDWIKMKDVSKEDTDERYSYVRIGPYGNNLLKWHFSVMGPPNSEYDGGIYHGRVLLPKDYPGSPPRVQVLTPCGRFISGHDICLSASNYHPESWTPKWTVLALIDALRLHMITQANEIGGMTATPSERRRLARASRSWSSGRISHRTMISQGGFQWESDVELSAPACDGNKEEEHKTGKRVASMRASDPTHGPDRVPKDRGLTEQMSVIAFEILSSPQRLAVVALIALFLILNLN